MNITINGKVCEGCEGQTILDVARANGIYIPTLCHLAELTPTGACRICLVEVEGARNLVAACSSPITEGMKVNTNTERVLDARRFVVELLVSCHPLDCMICEKTGDCTLQNLAYELGVTGTRMEGEKHDYPVDSSNPFIVRDYNKCILCQKCVRVCDEIQGIEAIKNTYRGFDTKIATAYDSTLQDSNLCFLRTVRAGMSGRGPDGNESKRQGARHGRLKRSVLPVPIVVSAVSLICISKGEQIVKDNGRGRWLAKQGTSLCKRTFWL